jgi:hypothetical protein
MQMMFILYYKLLSYYMDTITILGISLLFFYSLTTILQFYGIDTSVYSIYILFYIFIIVSRLILPMNYAKLFPETEAPLTNDVASGPIANDNDASSSPTIVFPPPQPQGQITNIDRVPVAPTPSQGQITNIDRVPVAHTPSQGQITNIDRVPVAPTPSQGQIMNINRVPVATSPSFAPNTTSNATPPKKPKNNAPSGPTDISSVGQAFGAAFTALSTLT